MGGDQDGSLMRIDLVLARGAERSSYGIVGRGIGRAGERRGGRGRPAREGVDQSTNVKVVLEGR